MSFNQSNVCQKYKYDKGLMLTYFMQLIDKWDQITAHPVWTMDDEETGGHDRRELNGSGFVLNADILGKSVSGRTAISDWILLLLVMIMLCLLLLLRLLLCSVVVVVGDVGGDDDPVLVVDVHRHRRALRHVFPAEKMK